MSYQPCRHERGKREMWKIRSYFWILPAVVSPYLSLLISLEPHTIWLCTHHAKTFDNLWRQGRSTFLILMMLWSNEHNVHTKAELELEQVIIRSGLKVCACKDNNSKLGRVAPVWIPFPSLSDVFPLDLFRFMPHLALFLLLLFDILHVLFNSLQLQFRVWCFLLTFMCLFCSENISKLFLSTNFTLKKEMLILNNTGESTDRMPVVD